MGRSRIVIETVGNHGCDRTAKPGEALKTPCDSPGCLECQIRKVIDSYVASQGTASFTYDGCGGIIIHWPNDPNEVVDDLVKGTRRHGEFK